MSSEDAQTDTKSIYTILYIYIYRNSCTRIYIYIHTYIIIFSQYILIYLVIYICTWIAWMYLITHVYVDLCGYIYMCVCGRCADPDVSHVNTGDGAH